MLGSPSVAGGGAMGGLSTGADVPRLLTIPLPPPIVLPRPLPPPRPQLSWIMQLKLNETPAAAAGSRGGRGWQQQI